MKLNWHRGERCINEIYYYTAKGDVCDYTIARISICGVWIYELWCGKLWVQKFDRNDATRDAAQSLEDGYES